MTTRLFQLALGVLVAVALLGGVATVSAADGDAGTDAMEWMHEQMGEHDHGEHHDGHDHSTHHENYDHGERHEQHGAHGSGGDR